MGKQGFFFFFLALCKIFFNTDLSWHFVIILQWQFHIASKLVHEKLLTDALIQSCA